MKYHHRHHNQNHHLQHPATAPAKLALSQSHHHSHTKPDGHINPPKPASSPSVPTPEPTARELRTPGQSFRTPVRSYKLAKPLQTVFLSTGQLTKRTHSLNGTDFGTTYNTRQRQKPLTPTKAAKPGAGVKELRTPSPKSNRRVMGLNWKLSPATPGLGSRVKLRLTQRSVDEDEETTRSMYSGLEVIGRGEFSVVYSGIKKADLHHSNRKRYAIKLFRLQSHNMVQSSHAALKEEAEILQYLHSLSDDERHSKQHLIEYVDSFGHSIVTEYCSKGTLYQFLSTCSQLDSFRIIKITLDILTGLRFMHKHNVVHLDLKPSNIFITSSGSLKIGDFGMASKLPVGPSSRALEEEWDSDKEGDRVYLAPEILNRIYTKFADVFSVGLIMLEMVWDVELPGYGDHWQRLRNGDMTMLDMKRFDNLIGKELELNMGLRRLVKRILKPIPFDRPSVSEILDLDILQSVSSRRKLGAVVYETSKTW